MLWIMSGTFYRPFIIIFFNTQWIRLTLFELVSLLWDELYTLFYDYNVLVVAYVLNLFSPQLSSLLNNCFINQSSSGFDFSPFVLSQYVLICSHSVLFWVRIRPHPRLLLMTRPLQRMYRPPTFQILKSPRPRVRWTNSTPLNCKTSAIFCCKWLPSVSCSYEKTQPSYNCW